MVWIASASSLASVAFAMKKHSCFRARNPDGVRRRATSSGALRAKKEVSGGSWGGERNALTPGSFMLRLQREEPNHIPHNPNPIVANLTAFTSETFERSSSDRLQSALPPDSFLLFSIRLPRFCDTLEKDSIRFRHIAATCTVRAMKFLGVLVEQEAT